MSTRELVPTHPVHTEIRPDEFYEGLDPGIRYAVRVLHYAGIPTCQSCEGGPGHAYQYPSIDMTEARAFEAMTELERIRIRVRSVASIWSIDDGVPAERIWRVILRDRLADYADDIPMFVRGHLHRECWMEA